MFLDAARVLATRASAADLAEGALFPRIAGIREISRDIAAAVVSRGVREGHCDAQQLEGLEQRLGDAMWFPDYHPFRAEA